MDYYEDDDDLLKSRVEETLESLEKLTKVITDRVRRDRYSDEYIDYLNEERKALLDWEVRLRRFRY